MVLKSQKKKTSGQASGPKSLANVKEINDKPVPARVIRGQFQVNIIHDHDCQNMSELPNESIDLLVTSPPYNTTKKYDDNLTLNEYLEFIHAVMSEAYRVMKIGGIIAFNIANVGRKPYLPLDCYVIQVLRDIGFLIVDELCWGKGASAGGSCAWGSWKSASNPSLRDVHEYIIIASKSNGKMEIQIPQDDLSNLPEKLENRNFSLNFNEFFTNFWSFSTESAKRVNHPAPFPVELPYRLILMFSNKGDVVLDPFMGSGSVAIAALIAGRKFVGYELKKQYIEIASERIKNLSSFRKKGEKRW
ncbi:MAG: DNA-methyltransferase [Promethearchaeota archaeon]